MLNPPQSASVVCLFVQGRPSAIFSTIRSVVVNAFNGAVLWPWTHIAKERREVIAPVVANVDASPTVSGVVLPLLVIAAVFDSRPRFVLSRAAATVAQCFDCGCFSTDTATTTGVPIIEVRDKHVCAHTTIATAIEAALLSLASWSLGLYYKATEPITGAWPHLSIINGIYTDGATK